jgi:hypothetical protein
MCINTLHKGDSDDDDDDNNNCVRPDDGSLIGAETCCLHRCKFVQYIVVLDGYLVYGFIL